MRPPRHRFTLIELLVVIAVIALLVGLLLPAVLRSKEKGRAAECMNKLKQMSVATMLYAEDYDDYVPRISTGGYPSGLLLFTDLLELYLSGEDLWICPSGEEVPQSRRNSGNGMLLHYGMNNYDYDDSPDDVDLDMHADNYLPGLGRDVQIREVAKPEEVIYLADADPDSSPENIGGMQSGTRNQGVPYDQVWPLTSLCEERHIKGYNALFIAGSVQRRANVMNHVEWAVLRRRARWLP